MLNKIVLITVTIAIVGAMLFGNKKVRVLSVLLKQLRVFKNAKTGKISIWDDISFIVLPIALSLLIVVGFERVIDNVLAEVLTIVFVLLFAVLFCFAAFFGGRVNSDNEIDKQVAGETLVSVTTSGIISLISTILSLGIVHTENEIAMRVLSVIIYSFSFMMIMLLLMIAKRTFILSYSKLK